MIIILYIEVIQSALMCYCKRKMYSVVNLYSDDVIVDVITICRNRNFHLRHFVKVQVVTVCILGCCHEWGDSLFIRTGIWRNCQRTRRLSGWGDRCMAWNNLWDSSTSVLCIVSSSHMVLLFVCYSMWMACLLLLKACLRLRG